MKKIALSRSDLLACVAIYASVGVIAFGSSALAQSVSSAGQNWSSGWNFPSASDISVAQNQAQMMQNVENPAASAVVNYYTVNNNGSDNITTTGSGTVTASVHVGNTIGTNTNSVGSMNTGTTNLTVTGTGNNVAATNSSSNTGSTDGSVTTTSTSTSTLASVLAATAGVGTTATADPTASATPTGAAAVGGTVLDVATSGIGSTANATK